MNSKTFFLLLSMMPFLLTSKAQDRAPHGLAYENPVAFSPSAVDFFHPKTRKPDTAQNPCTESSGCSPFPLAAQVDAAEDQQSLLSTSQSGGNGSNRLGAGSIAGIIVGLAFALVVTTAGAYVFITRRANANRSDNSKSVQPDA